MRKLRLQKGEAAQPVLGFAVLYEAFRTQVAKSPVLHNCGKTPLPMTMHRHTLQIWRNTRQMSVVSSRTEITERSLCYMISDKLLFVGQK